MNKLVDGQLDIVEYIENIFKGIGDNLRSVQARKIENDEKKKNCFFTSPK